MDNKQVANSYVENLASTQQYKGRRCDFLGWKSDVGLKLGN